MQFFLVILVIGAFIQSSLVNLNLCLVLLSVRALVLEKKENFYLAFFSGILLGVLTSKNLGFYPILFIFVVKLLSILNQTRITPTNYLVVLPACLIVFTVAEYLEKFFFGESVSFVKIAIETVLVIPTFLIISVLEDRLTPKGGIRLRV